MNIYSIDVFTFLQLRLPILESWWQPHYIHTGMMNQTLIWASPGPAPPLISSSEDQREQVIKSVKKKKKKRLIYRQRNRGVTITRWKKNPHPSPLHGLQPVIGLLHGSLLTHSQSALTLVHLCRWIPPLPFEHRFRNLDAARLEILVKC